MSRHRKTRSVEDIELYDEDPTNNYVVQDDLVSRAESAQYRVFQYPEDFKCKYTSWGEQVLFCTWCSKIINTKSSRVNEHIKSIRHLENKGVIDGVYRVVESNSTPQEVADENEEVDSKDGSADPYRLADKFPDDLVLVMSGDLDGQEKVMCKYCPEVVIDDMLNAARHVVTKTHLELKQSSGPSTTSANAASSSSTTSTSSSSSSTTLPANLAARFNATRHGQASATGSRQRRRPSSPDSDPQPPLADCVLEEEEGDGEGGLDGEEEDEDYYKIRGTCALLSDLDLLNKGQGVADVKFVCREGQLFFFKAVLSHHSSFFRRCFHDNSSRREVFTVHLPDVSFPLLRKALELLQNKSVEFKSSEEIEQFKQVYALLQLDLIPLNLLDFKPIPGVKIKTQVDFIKKKRSITDDSTGGSSGKKKKPKPSPRPFDPRKVWWVKPLEKLQEGSSSSSSSSLSSTVKHNTIGLQPAKTPSRRGDRPLSTPSTKKTPSTTLLPEVEVKKETPPSNTTSPIRVKTDLLMSSQHQRPQKSEKINLNTGQSHHNSSLTKSNTDRHAPGSNNKHRGVTTTDNLHDIAESDDKTPSSHPSIIVDQHGTADDDELDAPHLDIMPAAGTCRPNDDQTSNSDDLEPPEIDMCVDPIDVGESKADEVAIEDVEDGTDDEFVAVVEYSIPPDS